MNNPKSTNVRAVMVNHNTSMFTELALRSFFAMHDPSTDISITVMDNASEDDMRDLKAYADKVAVPIVQSGFTVAEEVKTRGVYGENVHGVNSHGEILTKFIMGNTACNYYLLLDADICFVERNTISTMISELEENDDAFGVGARQSNGEGEFIPIPNKIPDICETRLHPCCALIKNSALFQQVVEEFGMSDVKFLLAEGERIYPTCKLMTRVMKTHGLRHIISKAEVAHRFAVTYNTRHRHFHDEWCSKLLQSFREQKNGGQCAPMDAGKPRR